MTGPGRTTQALPGAGGGPPVASSSAAPSSEPHCSEPHCSGGAGAGGTCPPSIPSDRAGGGLLVALAAALCLLPLALPQPSLWFDEALSVTDGWLPRGLNHNPLWYALLRGVTGALGGQLDEVGLRALSVGASAATALLLAWATRPLLGGRGAGWAALLWSLSPWALHWATNARPYASGALLVTAGLGLWVRGARADAPLRALVGLGVMALAGAFQLAFLVVPASLGLVSLLPRAWTGVELARTRRWVLGAGLLGAVGLGPWVLGTLSTYLGQKQEITGLAGLLHFAASAGFHLSPVLGIAALLGALAARRQGGGVLLLLGLGSAVGACLVGGVSLLGQTTAQYVFGFLPLACALAGAACARRGWVAGFVVLGLATGSVLELGPQRGSRSPWREAFAWIEAHRGPDEAVFAMQAGLGDLYTRPGWTDARHPRALAPLDRTRPHDLMAFARGDRSAWVLVRPDFLLKWPAPDRERLEEVLRLHGEHRARFEAPAPGRDLALEVWYLDLAGGRE